MTDDHQDRPAEGEPLPDHGRSPSEPVPPGHPGAVAPLPDDWPRQRGDVFHVPVGPAGGFEAIVAALTRKLATTAVPTHIGMVGLYPFEQPGRFTQCLVDVEMGAWAECVSNAYLADGDRPSDADVRQLHAVGFNPPDDEHPNHWFIQEPPVDWPFIAHLLVAPFGTVWPVRPNQVMELVVNPTFDDRTGYELDDDEDWPRDSGQA